MRTIKEYVNLASEELIPLSKAGDYFPVKLSRPSVERLWRRGCRGVLLETIFICNRRYTSRQVIARHIERTQRTDSANRR